MTDAGAISRQAMRWMIFGEWRAYPGRVIVTAIVIAVGVALGFAVHLINASALNEFARAIRTVNGDADLQVQSTTPLGFDEALYPTLARLEGIAGASPVFEMQARLAGTRGNGGPDNGMTLLGIDIFRAANVTPSLLGQSAGSSDPFDPSAIFLSQAALDVAHLAIGDSIVLDVGGRTGSYVIAGTLPAAAEGQRLAVLDIAEAQWRFGRLGRLHRVDLKLANGVDAARVRDAISKVLPAGAEISDAESEAQRGDAGPARARSAAWADGARCGGHGRTRHGTRVNGPGSVYCTRCGLGRMRGSCGSVFVGVSGDVASPSKEFTEARRCRR